MKTINKILIGAGVLSTAVIVGAGTLKFINAVEVEINKELDRLREEIYDDVEDYNDEKYDVEDEEDDEDEYVEIDSEGHFIETVNVDKLIQKREEYIKAKKEYDDKNSEDDLDFEIVLNQMLNNTNINQVITKLKKLGYTKVEKL